MSHSLVHEPDSMPAFTALPTYSCNGYTRGQAGRQVGQTYRQLLELLFTLAGPPEDALQLTAGCQHIGCKGKVGPKLMHHCT